MEPLQVIAAPRRMRILELVWDREMSAGEIAAEFEVSWSAVSQHLRVLREAGFVVERGRAPAASTAPTRPRSGSLRSVVEDHWRQRPGPGQGAGREQNSGRRTGHDR